MTAFPSQRAWLPDCGAPPGPASTASVQFGCREQELPVGFVTARVRLFNLLHRGWAAESGVLTELLAALDPSGPAGPPSAGTDALVPRRVIVRLGEPAVGSGLVVFPICWRAGDRGGSSLLDVELALRSGQPGRSFLRLHGSFRLPPPVARPTAAQIRLIRPPVTTEAEAWLLKLATALADPTSS